MAWPTPQDYNEAIQNPRHSFRDPELMAGSPELTVLGLPRPITGNFASVYRLRCGRRDWAVRCFWREYADMAERYSAISRHLEAVKLSHTVAFEYLPDGIRVGGQWYPILKMEWVEGDLLNEYVLNHLHDAHALRDLAQRWTQMVQALEQVSIAHGDLQHGNVLVVDGELKLVDYDGMYVPGLAGRASHELGHQNYQHPRRSSLDFGPHTDRFSTWVIYVSLVALSISPDLWAQANAGDECLLLRKDDFESPETSSLLTSLDRGGDETIRQLATAVRRYLDVTPGNVPSLVRVGAPSPVTSGGMRHRLLAHVRHGNRPVSSVSTSIPAPSMPEWVAEVLSPDQRHLHEFTSVPAIPRATTACACAVLAAAILPAVFTLSVSSPALIAFSLVVVVCNMLLVCLFYRREPQVIGRRAVEARRRHHQRQLRSIQRRMRIHEKLRVSTGASHDQRILQLAERRSGLERSELYDRDVAHGLFQTNLAKIDECLEENDRMERDAHAAALKQARMEHMERLLKRHAVWSASVPQLDWIAKAQLWVSGVHTAHDVNAARIEALKRLGKERAAALLRWRLTIEVEARKSAPRRLDDGLKSRIVTRFDDERQRLRRERAETEMQESDLLNEIGRYYERKYIRIGAEASRVATGFTESCRRIAEAEEEARKNEPIHSWSLDRSLSELAPYENINLGRYFLAVVWGRDGWVSWGRQRTG